MLDDLERHRRPRVGDRELLLARRRGARARDSSRNGSRPWPSLSVHTVDYEWGERIRPDEVTAALAEHPVKAAAHAVRDLDRRDPADRAAREGCERRRRDGRGRCRLVARRRAVRIRRMGRRRRDRGSQKALSASPGSRSSRSASGRGKPHAPLRTHASTSTGPRTSASPTFRPREPVDPRSA